jgi:hypothetical protein
MAWQSVDAAFRHLADSPAEAEDSPADASAK